jgi:hypothetical protein
MGVMLHVKQLSRIIDGTKNRIVESEIEYDWLHKDNVCQAIIYAFVDSKFIWQIVICLILCQMW